MKIYDTKKEKKKLLLKKKRQKKCHSIFIKYYDIRTGSFSKF